MIPEDPLQSYLVEVLYRTWCGNYGSARYAVDATCYNEAYKLACDRLHSRYTRHQPKIDGGRLIGQPIDRSLTR